MEKVTNKLNYGHGSTPCPFFFPLDNSFPRVYIGIEAFTSGTIYVEGYKQKPDGWAEQLAAGDAKVYWAGEWEYDEHGTPKLI